MNDITQKVHELHEIHEISRCFLKKCNKINNNVIKQAGPDHLPFEASTLSGWREGSGSTFAGKAGGDRPWSSSSRKEKQRPQPRENLGKPDKGRPFEQGPGQGTSEARPI